MPATSLHCMLIPSIPHLLNVNLFNLPTKTKIRLRTNIKTTINSIPNIYSFCIPIFSSHSLLCHRYQLDTSYSTPLDWSVSPSSCMRTIFTTPETSFNIFSYISLKCSGKKHPDHCHPGSSKRTEMSNYVSD